MKKLLTLMCVGALVASGSGLVALADENAPETLVEATELVQDQPTGAEALVSENEADELVEAFEEFLDNDVEAKPENEDSGSDGDTTGGDEGISIGSDDVGDPAPPSDGGGITIQPADPIDNPVDNPIDAPSDTPTLPEKPSDSAPSTPKDTVVSSLPITPAVSANPQVVVAPSREGQKLTSLPATGEVASFGFSLLGLVMLLGLAMGMKYKYSVE